MKNNICKQRVCHDMEKSRSMQSKRLWQILKFLGLKALPCSRHLQRIAPLILIIAIYFIALTFESTSLKLNKMGGSISKGPKCVPYHERLIYLKQTPFFLYLQDETLKEFARCFPYVTIGDEGKILSLDEDQIYIVAVGELNLRTTLPAENSKVENLGYLCKKRPGEIVNKLQAQKHAVRKVRWSQVIIS